MKPSWLDEVQRSVVKAIRLVLEISLIIWAFIDWKRVIILSLRIFRLWSWNRGCKEATNSLNNGYSTKRKGSSWPIIIFINSKSDFSWEKIQVWLLSTFFPSVDLVKLRRDCFSFFANLLQRSKCLQSHFVPPERLAVMTVLQYLQVAFKASSETYVRSK